MLSRIVSFPGIIRDSRLGGILCNLVGRRRDNCWLSNPRRPPGVPYGSASASPAWFGSRRREHTLDGKGASARNQASKIRRDHEHCMVRIPAMVFGGLEAEEDQTASHSIAVCGFSRQTGSRRVEDSSHILLPPFQASDANCPKILRILHGRVLASPGRRNSGQLDRWSSGRKILRTVHRGSGLSHPSGTHIASWKEVRVEDGPMGR